MPELAIDGLTIALVLFAALLHASWNALTKASGDPFVNVAVVTTTGGVAALPFMFALPLPTGETWIWLGFSAAVHFVYQVSLARMYQLGDLSQVYPIARGLAPLGVAGLGALFAQERLELHQTLGLLLASFAIIALGRAGARGGSNREAVAMALLTALLIGTYTYSDAQGVRSVDRPERFIAWSFFLGAVPFALLTAGIRGRVGLVALRRDGLRAVGGGIMATIGYGIALWAMSRAPMASVASLRESSVLFAALIGTRLLGESLGRTRVLAAMLLVAGLVLVQLRMA
jgi:drug/metabolite transporter (DMT)-like permease